MAEVAAVWLAVVARPARRSWQTWGADRAGCLALDAAAAAAGDTGAAAVPWLCCLLPAAGQRGRDTWAAAVGLPPALGPSPPNRPGIQPRAGFAPQGVPENERGGGWGVGSLVYANRNKPELYDKPSTPFCERNIDFHSIIMKQKQLQKREAGSGRSGKNMVLYSAKKKDKTATFVKTTLKTKTTPSYYFLLPLAYKRSCFPFAPLRTLSIFLRSLIDYTQLLR